MAVDSPENYAQACVFERFAGWRSPETKTGLGR